MKEFSKIMALITWVPFIFIIGFTVFLIINPNYEINDTEVTVLVSMFTASASISATTNIFYLRKSQAENTYKVKLSLYEKVSEINLKNIEGIEKIKHQYNLEDYDINEIKNESPITDMQNYALNDLTDSVNTVMNDATQMIEKEEIL